MPRFNTQIDITYTAAMNERSVAFESIINGRTFIRDSFVRHPAIWIKIDKNFSQPLDDDNMRVRVPLQERVFEVVLHSSR